MSRENEWVASFVPELAQRIQPAAIPDHQLRAEAGVKLPYAMEVLAYRGSNPVENHISRYETDILVYEQRGDGISFPRVVIECKLGSLTTHDALTYSAKAATHKHVHPYLRYGILLGGWEGTAFPPRLVRHGAHFDFMATWRGREASSTEWDQLVGVLRSEVVASRTLQAMLSSRKRSKTRYSMLHRPIVFQTDVE